MSSPDFNGTSSDAIHGVGEPMLRSEDPKLVRGAGCYTDDINLPGQAYAAIVRSTQAHGRIRGIDTTAARAMPGVLGVYTGADMTGYGLLKSNLPFKNRDGSDMRKPHRPAREEARKDVAFQRTRLARSDIGQSLTLQHIGPSAHPRHARPTSRPFEKRRDSGRQCVSAGVLRVMDDKRARQ